MKYADGRHVAIGDRVRLWGDEYGTVVCSIDTAPAWSTLSDVEVLHPHGLLPYQESGKISKKGVVFTCHVKGSKPGQQADATVTETKNNGSVHFVVP